MVVFFNDDIKLNIYYLFKRIYLVIKNSSVIFIGSTEMDETKHMKMAYVLKYY